MFYSKLSYHYGSSVQSFNFNDGHALFLTFVPFSIMQFLNSRRLMCDLFNRILILVVQCFCGDLQLYKTKEDKYLLDLQRIQGPQFLFMDLCASFLAELRVLWCDLTCICLHILLASILGSAAFLKFEIAEVKFEALPLWCVSFLQA